MSLSFYILEYKQIPSRSHFEAELRNTPHFHIRDGLYFALCDIRPTILIFKIDFRPEYHWTSSIVGHVEFCIEIAKEDLASAIAAITNNHNMTMEILKLFKSKQS